MVSPFVIVVYIIVIIIINIRSHDEKKTYIQYEYIRVVFFPTATIVYDVMTMIITVNCIIGVQTRSFRF